MSEFIKAIGIFYMNELNFINTYLVNKKAPLFRDNNYT